MMEWKWISLELAHVVHERQLAEHGGREGIRDLGAIESALARPVQLAHYTAPDVFDLAAAYCWGIARNHGYVDGNKRTAWILARIFLVDHGVRLRIDPFNAIRAVEGVAAGALTQDELAAWLRSCAIE
jgi:death on curing protein